MKTLALISFAMFAVGCKSDDPVPDFPDAPPPDADIDASPTCFDPSGTPAHCFLQTTCVPEDDVDFLNGCTDGQCIPYDNPARLPRFNGGNLPPLP
jgi:hypothetical protein